MVVLQVGMTVVVHTKGFLVEVEVSGNNGCRVEVEVNSIDKPSSKEGKTRRARVNTNRCLLQFAV